MRALEEEAARVTMRGRGKFTGAGGVPSMGLSQYVGGGHDDDSSSDDEECRMCGGMIGGLTAPAGSRYVMPGPRGYGGPKPSALVPYRANQPARGPLTRYTPVRQPAPVTSRALTTRQPGTIKPYSAAEARARIAELNKPAARSRMSPAARRAALATAGAALLATGLGVGLSGPSGAAGAAGDGGGYYDDFTGDDGGGDVVLDDGNVGPGGTGGPGGPIVGPSGPIYGPGGMGDGMGDGMGGMDGAPADLTQREVQFYLQSGNLPDRFYAGPRTRKGAGRGKGRRSERAAIVKRVMAEKGMKMTDASRYVKQNGLY